MCKKIKQMLNEIAGAINILQKNTDESIALNFRLLGKGIFLLQCNFFIALIFIPDKNLLSQIKICSIFFDD